MEHSLQAVFAIFLGLMFGMDHFVLSGCSCPGVVFGVLKAVTLAGCGLWWLIDIIVACSSGYVVYGNNYPIGITGSEWDAYYDN
jgi:hypothetical protein